MAWTGLNSLEPVAARSAGTDAGHAEHQVEHAPDEHAETRPRDDVQWEVRAEVQARQADHGGQCPGQDLPSAFQVGASRAVIAKITMA